MNVVQIKQEPLDYNDVPEVHLQLQMGESKDINLNNIKTEPEEIVPGRSLGFAEYSTLSDVDETYNAQGNHAGDITEEVKCSELISIMSNVKRGNHYDKVPNEDFQCVFNCGASFSNWKKCSKHEKEEAIRFYQNENLLLKKRKTTQDNELNHFSVVEKNLNANMCTLLIDTPNLFCPEFDNNIHIKKEISEDLEPDKDNETHELEIFDSNFVIRDKVEIKEEPLEEYNNSEEPVEEIKSVIDEDFPPIPKIKVPASLLNSLKAAQNVPKFANSFKTFGRSDPPFELKTTISANRKHSTASIRKTNKAKNSVSVQIPKTILQPITLANSPFKIVSPNIKILKLPPNTKIIKLEPKSPDKTATCTQIQINQNDQPEHIQTNPEAEAILKEAIIQENKRQKVINFVPKPTLHMIEQLPESKKAISELLQKVKEAEAKKGEGLKHSEDTEPIQNQEVTIATSSNQSITISTNLNSDDSNSSLSSTVDSHLSSIFIDMNGDDSILTRMRRLYPHFRCFWICPFCPRQYALRNTLRTHLDRLHSLGQKQLDALLLEVKIFHLGGDAPEFETVLKSSLEMSQDSSSIVEPPCKRASSAKSDKSKDTYNCKKCGRKCSSRIALRDHVAANCSREPQYQCSQCPKKFFSVSTLNCHVTIHTGELPHKCNYCDKRFRTRGQVTVHHRTHTGERPFKCQVCSQSFTHRETLIAHLSRHIGMKRYKCYACNKQFSCISGLRTHRDTRPDTCGKVKFNPRALGPRVRVVKGNVIFEPQPEVNPYLRSDSPPEVNSD